MLESFLQVFKNYLLEIIPAVALGFFLSGLIHEFVSVRWVEKYLGGGGLKPIIYSTILGTILPICCWGSLPIAITFHKKGTRLGPLLAFLVATPATSISALLVTYKLLGPFFTLYIFGAVIVMGIIIGLLGNLFHVPLKEKFDPEGLPEEKCCQSKKRFTDQVKSIFKFAFVDMIREIGPEMLLGIALAALVSTFIPLGHLIKTYLSSGWGYLFSLVFGLLTYICATASVPLVSAFIDQGLNIGAGLVLLLIGPITSYGTILVIRKEFGFRILSFYLGMISLLGLILGYLFSFIYNFKI